MSDSNTPLRISIVSPDDDLISWFYDDLGVDASQTPAVTRFSDRDLVLNPFVNGSGSPDTESNVLLGLIRFVDVLSLQKMEEMFHAVPHSESLPTTVLVYRNENEQDFKMSCPYCGQKLWVRDADLDKRGRCPHCKKGFTLPVQEAHVRSVLRLHESVPVHRILRGDSGSLAAPMRELVNLKHSSILAKLKENSKSFSNQTMNVDVEVDDEGA